MEGDCQPVLYKLPSSSFDRDQKADVAFSVVELSRLRAAGKSEIATLADLGKPLNNASDFAANNSDKARTAFVEMIHGTDDVPGRSTLAPQRVLSDFRDAAGDAHAPTRIDEIKNSLRSWAADAYGKLRGMDSPFDGKAVAAALQHPDVRAAWNYARKAGDIAGGVKEGEPLDKLFEQITNPVLDVARGASSATKESAERAITFSDLQQFKRLLDARIKRGYTAGDGELGNAYKTVRDKVKSIIVDKIPKYTAIDSEYARRKGLIKAVEAGVKAFHSDDIAALKKTVAALSPKGLEQFRHGLASEQIIALQGKGTANSAVKEIVSNAPAQQERLRVVFGDEKTFDSFMQKAKAEKKFIELHEAVGGSQTHRRGAASENNPLSVLQHGLSLTNRAWNATLGLGGKAIQRRTASNMAPALLTKGGDAIERLLSELEKNRSPLINHWLSDQVPAGIGTGIGSLFH